MTTPVEILRQYNRWRRGDQEPASLGVERESDGMMMWKLKHRLFGWDYIQWRNNCDAGIARVHVDGMGRAYYWRYPTIRVADIIRDPDAVLWLTCPPHKYMAPVLVINAQRLKQPDCAAFRAGQAERRVMRRETTENEQ